MQDRGAAIRPPPRGNDGSSSPRVSHALLTLRLSPTAPPPAASSPLLSSHRWAYAAQGVAITTWAFDVYGEGELNPTTGYFWVTLVVNFSQLWALYVLVFFYHALREELAPVKPLGKFLTVKGVVFFAWWQSVGISAGLSMHIVEPDSEMTTTEFASFCNDWVMCCEMFIAAVAFHYAYSYKDFYRYDRDQHGLGLGGLAAQAATYLSAINSSANATDYIQV